MQSCADAVAHGSAVGEAVTVLVLVFSTTADVAVGRAGVREGVGAGDGVGLFREMQAVNNINKGRIIHVFFI